MPITVSISRSFGGPPPLGGSPGTFDVVFPDGTIQEVSQTVQSGRWSPAIATCNTCIGGLSGFITKARPTGQTFNYANLLNRNEISQVSAIGITSFDVDLTGYTSLSYVGIGNYCSFIGGDGSFPFNPSFGSVSISSFSTKFPTPSWSPVGRPGSVFIFSNNTVNCAFNPIFQTRTSDNNKWVLTFRNNNAQQTLSINAEHLCNVNIFSNSSLTSVIINNLKFQNNVSNYNVAIDGNSGGGLNISNNQSLTNIQINNTNLDTQTTVYKIYFVNNNLSQTSFNETNITYPPNRNVYIYLGANNFSNFTPSFINPKVYLLDINSQRGNVLTTIPDSATLPTSIKEFYFNVNNVTQCPYLPSGILKVNMSINPIVCTSDRPNFRTTMTDFVMGGITTGGGTVQTINIGSWLPNIITTNNEGLQNCQNIANFNIAYTNINSWTHQFAPTMTNANATLTFEGNQFTTMNMSLLSGFKTINLSNQRNNSLQSLSNLHLNTTVTSLNLSNNFALSPANQDSIIQGAWPPQLKELNLGYSNTNSNITTWNKSFAGFATNPSNSVMQFTWQCSASNQSSVDSVSFILRDMITATTKTGGTLRFGGVFGTLIRGMVYPLSTRDQFTKDCYACLIAPGTVACSSSIQSSNAIPSNLGRAFGVFFGGTT